MGVVVRRRWRASHQRGQSLVEFALVLPIFVLLLFGVVDAGRLVYTNAALSQAAREGARLAAAEAAWIGLSGPGCVSSPAGIGAATQGPMCVRRTLPRSRPTWPAR